MAKNWLDGRKWSKTLADKVCAWVPLIILLVKIPSEDFTDVTLAMQMMLELVVGVMDTDVEVAGMDEMDEN